MSSTPTDTPTSTNYVLVASYLTIIALWAASPFVLIPYTAHLLLLVTAILYAACHGSLVLLEQHEVTNSDGEVVKKSTERETMRSEDAYQFPLVGSLSLFSLYLAFRFLDPEVVNLVISVYFGLVSTFAVGVTLAPVVKRLLPIRVLNEEMKWENQFSHPFGKDKASSPIEWTINCSLVEILALVIAAGITGLYFYQSKPWYLNNIMGISFCLQGIERFSLGTYKIGAILLVGLFFYDIFWVFGTDVMVTVAKKLDGPIKILLPRSMERNEETGQLKDLSLLGLGDIVIPGFFLALLLRFDARKAAAATTASLHHASFPKPYFHTALVAYVIGLGTTLFVMMRFQAAQPALLYLVPACLISSMGCAAVRGEVKELFAYSEEEDEEESAEGAESSDKKKD